MHQHQKIFHVLSEHVDFNDHMNNMAYIHLMLEAAGEHSILAGVRALIEERNQTWFIREHSIKYLHAARLDDEIALTTFFIHASKVISRRGYEFKRVTDDKIICKAWTDWVLVDKRTQRPVRITDDIIQCFSNDEVNL